LFTTTKIKYLKVKCVIPGVKFVEKFNLISLFRIKAKVFHILLIGDSTTQKFTLIKEIKIITLTQFKLIFKFQI